MNDFYNYRLMNSGKTVAIKADSEREAQQILHRMEPEVPLHTYMFITEDQRIIAYTARSRDDAWALHREAFGRC